jgi:hypothetical protein
MHEAWICTCPQLSTHAFHAGQRRCPPHSHLPGITKKPPRGYTAGEHRRVLRLGVALMVEAGTVVVKTLSGSTWSDHVPTRQYMTRKGKAATALSSEEYVDLLGIIFKHVTRAVMKKAGQLIFLHDRDPAHRTYD